MAQGGGGNCFKLNFVTSKPVFIAVQESNVTTEKIKVLSTRTQKNPLKMYANLSLTSETVKMFKRILTPLVGSTRGKLTRFSW